MSALTEDPLYSAGSLAGLTPATRAQRKSKSTHNDAETYRIVFWGQCARDYHYDDVKQAFAQRFKVSNQRVLEQLFSGKVITLKKGLTENQANKYVNAILAVGGICRKESENHDYFSETEFMQRKSVSFLEDDFDPSTLSLAPKDEFTTDH